MENPEEILHSLEEFAKMKPKDIPRELEEYLKFVAKTGDPVYQWPAIKSLFREKLISVITEFYESCASMEIPPCPNVEMFNYDLMKTFILEKLDTFASAPFTLQRICELLTSPRKEYTRIDKYMRALEKNMLVVSTMEPCGKRTENGESIMNGVESDHETVPDPANEINVEEMDDFSGSSYVQSSNHISFDNAANGTHIEIENTVDTFTTEKGSSEASTSSQEIVCVQYVSIEPVDETTQNLTDEPKEPSVSLTITAINVKEDRQDESNIEQKDSILTESTSDSTEMIIENINTPIVETEEKVQIENEPIEAATITISEVLTHSEAISSTEIIEKLPEDLDQPEVCSKNESLTKGPGTENISEDDNISSSEDTSCKSSTSEDDQLSTLTVEKVAIQPSEVVEIQPVATEENLTNVVDSTTRGSGDANPEAEMIEKFEADGSQDSSSSDVSMDSGKICVEQSPQVESTENDNMDSNNCDEGSFSSKEPTESVPVEPLKVEETNEVSVGRAVAKKEQPAECEVEAVSSVSVGDEETPMEVDINDESKSDVNSEQASEVKEADSVDPVSNS